MYGPTETTIWSAVRPLDARRRARRRSGGRSRTRPCTSLDEDAEPVPIGVPGELLHRRPRARARLPNRPELTAERFVRIRSTRRPARACTRPATSPATAPTASARVPRPPRPPGQAARLPHRARRDRVGCSRDIRRWPGWSRSREDRAGDAASRRLRDRRRMPPVSSRRASPLARRDAARVHGPVADRHARRASPSRRTARSTARRCRPPKPLAAEPEGEYVAPRTPLESRLAAIWEDELGIRAIGVTYDFFDLGATSIVAAGLFARIERELGASLPLAPVFQAPTIEALARLIEEGAEEGSANGRWTSLVPIQPQGSKRPIFCVHGGAGTILHLQPLARRLGTGQPFYGLQARGLYGGAAPLKTVEEMSRPLPLGAEGDPAAKAPITSRDTASAPSSPSTWHTVCLKEGEEIATLTMFNGPSPGWIRTFRGIGGQPSRVAARRPHSAARPLPHRVAGVRDEPRQDEALGAAPGLARRTAASASGGSSGPSAWAGRFPSASGRTTSCG